MARPKSAIKKMVKKSMTSRVGVKKVASKTRKIPVQVPKGQPKAGSAPRFKLLDEGVIPRSGMTNPAKSLHNASLDEMVGTRKPAKGAGRTSPGVTAKSGKTRRKSADVGMKVNREPNRTTRATTVKKTRKTTTTTVAKKRGRPAKIKTTIEKVTNGKRGRPRASYLKGTAKLGRGRPSLSTVAARKKYAPKTTKTVSRGKKH